MKQLTTVQYSKTFNVCHRYLQRLICKGKHELLAERYGITKTEKIGRTYLLTVRKGFAKPGKKIIPE